MSQANFYRNIYDKIKTLRFVCTFAIVIFIELDTVGHVLSGMLVWQTAIPSPYFRFGFYCMPRGIIRFDEIQNNNINPWTLNTYSENYIHSYFQVYAGGKSHALIHLINQILISLMFPGNLCKLDVWWVMTQSLLSTKTISIRMEVWSNKLFCACGITTKTYCHT